MRLRLESNLRLSLADRWPLIFTGHWLKTFIDFYHLKRSFKRSFKGAELYGPDPSGEVSSEVLLGRGAVPWRE